MNSDQFNLTLYLQAGFLVEQNLLVAPNGSRYEIPSGPPEGRQSLRKYPSELQHDSRAPSSLLDVEKNGGINLTSDHQPRIIDPLSGTQWQSTVKPSLSPDDGSIVWLPTNTSDQLPVQWSVLLIALVCASIAIFCNLTLISLLGWKLRRLCHSGERQKHSTCVSDAESKTDRRDDFYSQLTAAKTRAPTVRIVSATQSTRTASASMPGGTASTVNRVSYKPRRHKRFRVKTRPAPCRPPGHVSCSEDSCSCCCHSDNNLAGSTTTANDSDDERSQDSGDRVRSSQRAPGAMLLNRMNDYFSDSTTVSDDCRAAEPDRPTRLVNDSQQLLETSAKHSIPHCLPIIISIGIHIGVLGVTLSILQLAAICSALIQRTTDTGLGRSDLVCVLVCSLAADTLFCTRLYLITVFLISVLANRYCRRLFNQARAQPPLRLSSVVIAASTSTTASQSNFAHLALVHSLPWALAAGTALLITFVVRPRSNQFLRTDQLQLNGFFHGLDSLFKCPSNVDEATASEKLVVSVRDWLPPIMLSLFPLIALTCTPIVFTVADRCRNRVRLTSKHLRAWLNLSLLLCCEVACNSISAVSFLFSLYYHNRSSLSYLDRLSAVTLLLDPWLIGLLIYTMTTSPIDPLSINDDGSFNSLELTGYYRPSSNNGPTILSPVKQLTCLPLSSPGSTVVNNLPVIVSNENCYTFRQADLATADTVDNQRHFTLVPVSSPFLTAASPVIPHINALEADAQSPYTGQSLPQLCPRHRDLLFQQQNGPNHTETIPARPRDAQFTGTSVPRHFTTLPKLIEPPGGDQLDSKSLSTDVDVKVTDMFSHVSKSPATAAVMAAAAAAVAAQAGNLTQGH